MDNELHWLLYDLDETFNDTKYFINNLKNFNIKDNDIKGAKYRNEQNYVKLQKTLFYNKIFLRALEHKLNEFNSNDEYDEYDLYIRKYGPESDIDNYNTIIESRDNGDME
jgi:uncharacterized protein (DUF2252 family)